ncbi:MAG: hypothetical protein J1E40_07735 [Oscillospiraceae bacterium]|nr:hypothetical protein [Oscillospiraceae bacterium]
MRSNIKNTANEGVVRSGEYSYSKKPRTLKAYGKEYQLPVKTAEFSDKLAAANEAIAKSSNAHDVVEKIKTSIALFIGEKEVERIFPAEKINEIDMDEILGFMLALNFELASSQNDLIARYSASKVVQSWT